MTAIAETVKKFGDFALGYVAIGFFFLMWEIAPRLGWADAQFIPPLSQVLAVIWKLAVSGELFIHIAISLQRTLLGFSMAVLIAIPLGFILGGWAPALTRFISPLLDALAQVNPFTLFPIFIVLFGIGEWGKVCIIFWTTLWPVLFTTIAGVRQVDPLLVKCARSMGANGETIFFQVILPGAVIPIFAGIRTGLTMAFIMLIGAEMIGADMGLGWMIQNSEINNAIPRMYAAVVTIAVLGMALNRVAHWLEDNIVVWKETEEDGLNSLQAQPQKGV